MQAKGSARFPLNVYMLRGGREAAIKHVSLTGFPHTLHVRLDNDVVGTLYYGQSSSMPDWLKFFSALSEDVVDPDVRSASVSGILLVEIEARVFALTFGHAWQKIKQSGMEPNFGIRCVLNLAEKDSLRAIRRDRVAEDSIQAIEQIPDSDEIERFGMDVEKDLLRGVKAKIDPSCNFGVWVAGADSFKASIDLKVESLNQYLIRCLRLWEKDTYQRNFRWIDNISAIRDELLEVRLIEAVVDRVSKKDSAFSLCVPDLLSWDDHDFFSFSRKRRGQLPCANHLDLSHWVETVISEDGRITSSSLFDRSIVAYRNGDVFGGSWPVISCLHGMVNLDGKIYLLHAGHWYELNENFVDEINRKISSIGVSDIQLPPVRMREKEGEYNFRVAKESGGAVLWMDKKLICHGGGKSRIEVCDLFTDHAKIICVKPWGEKSGSLSHLFFQAKISIQLINNDPTYCEKVRAYIESVNSGFAWVWQFICEDPKDAEVILAVLRGPEKEKLPFFAKLSLVDTISDLRGMRFKATYLAVPVQL